MAQVDVQAEAHSRSLLRDARAGVWAWVALSSLACGVLFAQVFGADSGANVWFVGGLIVGAVQALPLIVVFTVLKEIHAALSELVLDRRRAAERAQA